MDSRLEVASKKKKGFFKKLSRMLGKSQNLEKAAEKQSAAEMKTVSGSFEDSSEILSNTIEPDSANETDTQIHDNTKGLHGHSPFLGSNELANDTETLGHDHSATNRHRRKSRHCRHCEKHSKHVTWTEANTVSNNSRALCPYVPDKGFPASGTEDSSMAPVEVRRKPSLDGGSRPNTESVEKTEKMQGRTGDEERKIDKTTENQLFSVDEKISAKQTTKIDSDLPETIEPDLSTSNNETLRHDHYANRHRHKSGHCRRHHKRPEDNSILNIFRSLAPCVFGDEPAIQPQRCKHCTGCQSGKTSRGSPSSLTEEPPQLSVVARRKSGQEDVIMDNDKSVRKSVKNRKPLLIRKRSTLIRKIERPPPKTVKQITDSIEKPPDLVVQWFKNATTEQKEALLKCDGCFL